MRISDWSSDVCSSDLDGYHRLQTVFRILDWGDTIRLRPRADGVVARHGDAAPGVTEAGDLTVRAARLLQTESKTPQGVDIAVEKRIPVGGGFGGGSSDAATVLRALDRLWGLDLGVGTLARSEEHTSELQSLMR